MKFRLVGLIILFALPVTVISQYPKSARDSSILLSMTSTFNFQGDTLGGGTCFLINRNSHQYFATAAHLFRSANKSGDIVPVTMVIQNKPVYLEPRVYFHENRKIDVAVMVLPEKIQQLTGIGLSLDTAFVVFGSDVLFYGFPLTNLGTVVPQFSIKLPLVKKATFSGVLNFNDVAVMVLDGHNNKGFSGGPVLTYDTSRKGMFVLGVISGFLNESRNIQYKEDRISFDENSGIILCYGRDYIEDIVRKIK